MIRKLIIIQLLVFLNLSLFGQFQSNFRFRNIPVNLDTLKLDTLSIIPGSERIFNSQNKNLETRFYKVDYANSVLTFNGIDSMLGHNLSITYRVYPINFSKTWYLRDESKMLSSDSLLGRQPKRYAISTNASNPFGDDLEVTGNISRGISVGNNQDLVVNSGMSLQFSGEIGSGISLDGAITDNAIPFQPQGNTLRFEEFDKVFIRAYSRDFEVQAGDILSVPLSVGIANYQRNVQGLQFIYQDDSEVKENCFKVKTSVSVAKGKFAKNSFIGTEKNQGPYKLKGLEGETYIIVIAGSEKVYVDGQLLTRGESNHYVIDYNIAELTFTSRLPITSNSRIIVEFEYSERSYARFIVTGDVEQKIGSYTIKTFVFSESDSKNQPLDIELSNDQVELLSSIGDNLDKAVLPQVDSVQFNADKILYLKKDTLVSGVSYQIYKYTTDSLLSHFQVAFTYLGEGKGSYIPVYGKTNGRIFKWVAPENGNLKGSYEPVKQLVTPKKRQIVSLSVSKNLERDGILNAEIAFSKNDINTFSTMDSNDDVGGAFKFDFKKFFKSDSLSKSWLNFNTLITSSNFKYIDRIKSVEFEREWNVRTLLLGGDERNFSLSGGYNKNRNSLIGSCDILLLPNNYQGIKNGLVANLNSKRLSNILDASYLYSSDSIMGSEFIRVNNRFQIKYQKVEFGAHLESEYNSNNDSKTDSLLPISYKWYQTNFQIGQPDSLNNTFGLNYKIRRDYKALTGAMKNFSTAQDVGFQLKLAKNTRNTIKTYVGYRLFIPHDTSTSITIRKEESMLGRLDYTYSTKNDFILTNINYELGSGTEPKYYFYYVEVPAGQGIFTWIDYNANGQKEIDEFEVANFKDEAKFIRINLPSNQYIPVNTNSFNILVDISPDKIENDSTNFYRVFSKLSNRFSLGGRQKNKFENFLNFSNPINPNIYDSSIVSVSQSIINTLAFNRYGSRFGLEWVYNHNVSKQVLANGFEISKNNNNQFIVRTGIAQNWNIITKYILETKEQESELFTSRNYRIQRNIPSVKFRYNASGHFSTEVGYDFEVTRKRESDIRVNKHTISADINITIISKTWLSLAGSYSSIEFNGETGTPLEYELLRGFKPGKNAIWELGMRKRISNYFELEMNYSGRYISTGQTVNTGNVQLKAVF